MFDVKAIKRKIRELELLVPKGKVLLNEIDQNNFRGLCMAESELKGYKLAVEEEISFLIELKNHYNNSGETYNKIKERIEELKEQIKGVL